MHILYIGNERRAAAVAARALHGTAPQVKVTWAQTLGSGASWLLTNRDVVGVIVEAEVQGQSCAVFVEQIRRSGLNTPVVIVAPQQSAAAVAALNAGAHGYVFDGDSLESDLPPILAAAIGRERSRREGIDRKLAELEASRDQAAQRAARAEEAREATEQRCASELAAAASRFADLQAQHTRSLARDARICGALQDRLIELETALDAADGRRAADTVESSNQLAKRHAEFTASLAEAARARDALATRLTAATAALDEVQQARRTDAAAAATDLARHEAEFAAAVAESVAARNALESALTEAEAAYRDVQQRAAADVALAADRETALQERLAYETATRVILEHRLGAAEAARQDAEQRYATELTDAAMRLADVQARFDTALTENAAVRATLEQQLVDAAARLRQSAQERESDATAAAGHLARREAELGVVLAEAYAARTTLEGALTDAKTAHRHALQCAAAELAASAEREAALEDLLAQEADTRAALEQEFATAEVARRDSEQWHATEVTALTIRIAAVEARHEAALTEHATARAAVGEQLAQAAAALERANQEHASELAAATALLARREAELGASLAEAVSRTTALDGALLEAEAAHRGLQQHAGAALTAGAEREAELTERLSRAAAARTALEKNLGESRTDAAVARRRFLYVVGAHRRRASEYAARIEAQTTCERDDWERRLAEQSEKIQQIQMERDTLQQLLATTREQLQRLQSTIEEERLGYERVKSASQSELQRLSAESDQLRQSLDQVRIAFQTVERIAGEHAIERARLESVVAQRDGELGAQAARHLAVEQAAQEALSRSQEKLRQTLETSSADVARLEREINALRKELHATRSRAEALRGQAERLPIVQMQLEDSRKERRREFERAPYGLCQCTRDGVITHVNHSLVRLLGYRRADDLIGVDVAATAFEHADDVRWLIERAVSTGKTETIEAIWKTRGRRRLVVRLQALLTRGDSVGIVVEDVTNVRALEDRLRQAERLESVGRLASEIAVTCDSVLRDAARDGEHWLAAIGSDTQLRHQGERLLGEVKRAASFVQQFAGYGKKQMSALEPVSVPRVFRDLEPVMKRIVGDDVELVFAALSPSLDVDLDAERLERIFVNVANYARGRMPHGGQMRIEASSTVVGRRFTARYPHARVGPHVLITVAERPTADHQELLVDLTSRDEAADHVRPASDKPVVEVGALLELVVNSGGHLWMEAEPAGGMVLKIHLPKRASDDAAEPLAPAGRFAKWFRTRSAAVAG